MRTFDFSLAVLRLLDLLSCLGLHGLGTIQKKKVVGGGGKSLLADVSQVVDACCRRGEYFSFLF